MKRVLEAMTMVFFGLLIFGGSIPGSNAQGLPDLVVTNIIAPNVTEPSSRINITWTVLNQGDVPAAAFYDTLYISNDVQLDNSDTWITNLTGPDVNVKSCGSGGYCFYHSTYPRPGDTSTATVEAKLPALAPGNYYLIVRTNGGLDWRSIEESDLSNNTRSIPITIKKPNPLFPPVTSTGSAPEIEWTKTFYDYNAVGHSVRQTIDGGYIILGDGAPWVGVPVLYLVKTDADGNIQWDKVIGELGTEYYAGWGDSSLQQTTDGEYVMCGRMDVPAIQYAGGALLIKTYADGNVKWTKYLQYSNDPYHWEGANSLEQTIDGGYIITGYTWDQGEVWLVKTDVDGNVEWERTFSPGVGFPSTRGCGYSVKQSSDGGYIIVATNSWYGDYYPCVWLIKTDKDGYKIWDRQYCGSYGYTTGYSVQETKEGGYVFVATSTDARGSNIILEKTDKDGNQEWERTFSKNYNTMGFSVQQTTDDGYVLVGLTGDYEHGYDLLLIKVDANGNDLWDMVIGAEESYEEGRSVQETTDGGYIIGGSTGFYPNYAMWLMKLKGRGSAYMVTASVGGDPAGGSVSPSSQTVNHGATATFTVTTNTGYTAAVSEGTLSGSTWTIPNITSTHSVALTFTKSTYTVTASVAGDSAGGSVSPSSQTVSPGATATFTVTTNTGYTATVSEGSLSGSTWTIPNITSTHTVTVTFTKSTYTVTASVAGDSAGGSVSPSSQTVSPGATATFTVTTNTGYTAAVSEGTLSGSTWTIPNITSTHTVTVTFKKTATVTVQLKDSNGNPLSGGVVQYYSGGWQAFGTTDAGGQVTKELLPLTYTFSMTYGFARQEKSQNIATNPTVVFQTTNVTILLKDSTGALMDTGTVQYYSGGWRDIGATSSGQVTKELLPLTYTFSMTYGFARQEKSQNIATNPTVVFQTTRVTIELRDSSNRLINDPGTVQYYSGGWRDIGATSSGQATKELLPLTYTFSMTYGFARQEKSQNIATNSTVVFQTTNVTIQLKDSTGALMDTGTVQYYSGGWRDIGATSGGRVSKELLPLTYTFSMTYGFARQEKSQNIATNPTVVFQTTNVTIQLKDSTGALMDTGTVQYYSGGWRDIGSTSGGQVSKELLPGSYTFSMNYAFARQEKAQNIASNPIVVFQTINTIVQLKDSTGTLMDTGTVQYYSGGWRDIGSTSGGQVSKELLPASYTFSMNYAYARQEKAQNIASNPTVVFQTISATVQLKDSTGALMDTGTVQYYSGGWRDIGTTSGGQVTKELLPATYTFSMNYGYARQEKSQNIATNPTVVFQTTNVIVQLKDSTGALIDTGTVQYYSGGWRDIGSTSSGQVTKELLPLSYTFSMTYGFARQEKSQNVATNPTVVFQTGQVHSDSGSCTHYYAGGWRTFTQDMELLPVTYTFRFNDGTSEGSYKIITGTVNHIH